jgi:serine phosphatase RsbU (regulator of sigma subunit)/anti-sigma regulatory factor (Ser/Thr protein kinase)
MADSHDDADTTLVHRPDVARVGGGPARTHYLLIIEGPGKGQRIALGKNPIVIGRSEPADFVLADPRVSRAHCRVCLAMDEVIVVDLESRNGTFIDGERVASGAPLPPGSRLEVGSHVLEHEWRARKEVEDSVELDRDLAQAAGYIQALLPGPLAAGPIRSDWVLAPCARLGGDAFGYRFLDQRFFAIYLIDVSGHGAGAAMHAVSIINMLRQGALPDTDLRDPAGVLGSLNEMFRMEAHGQLYLTVWYGVYDLERRSLAYACAGHHAAFLVGPAGEAAVPLQTRNIAIGLAPNANYTADVAAVSPGSRLYVFSDGVFEIVDTAGVDWSLDNFVPLLLQPRVDGLAESRRLLDLVRQHSKDPDFEDDFTLITFSFPPQTYELTLPADAAEGPRAAEWLEVMCSKHGVPRESVDRLLLCLDDAFANVLAHGGPAALSQPIGLQFEIEVDAQSRTAIVTLSDAGIAFDPVSAPDKPLPKTLEEAVPSGRGLQMIRACASVLRYRREGGRNHLTFGTRWELK